MNHSAKWNVKQLPRQSGVSMIEVLVSLIILMVGLLGLAGLMMHSQSSEMESYQRVQALILLQDMAGRLNANRNVASCYNFTTGTGGTSYIGVGGASPTCGVGTTTQQTRFTADMNAWRKALIGVGETIGVGNNVGAMIGARGCISYNGASANLVQDKNSADIAGTGVYTIAVSWQGISNTFAPAPLSVPAMYCGKLAYNSENQRRIVSLTVRIGSINNTI
jgi:type IV pilus assembly protein PilV